MTDTAPQSLRRRLFSGGAWALGGKVTTAFTGLISNAFLARLLSPQELGTYFLAFSVASLCAIAGSLGLNQAAVRFVAASLGLRQFGRARRTVGIVCALGVVGAATVALAYVFAGQFLGTQVFHSSALIAITGLVAGWIVMMTLQNLLAEIFRGFHDLPRATVFSGLLTGVLLTICLGLLLLFEGQADLSTAVVVAAASSSASVLLASWMLRRKLATLPSENAAHHIEVSEILRTAWPLLITSLTLFVLTQAGLWIVGASLSQGEVALYGAAVRVVTLVIVPLLVINAVVSPLIAEMHAQQRRQELQRVLRSTATAAAIPALLMVLPLAAVSGQVLGLVFGDYYAEGAMILTVLSLGQLANVFAGSCGITLMMTGRQAALMTITVFSGVFTVTGSLIAVRGHGAIGVAVVAAVGMVIQNVLTLLFVRRRIGVWTHISPALLLNRKHLSGEKLD